MKLFDMMTDEDIKRLKKDSGPIDLTLKIDQLELENKKLKKRVAELDNSLSIALEINDRYQRNRPLNTMDEIAYRELETKIKELEGKCREAGRTIIELNVKYEGMIKEVDRLSEENTNLRVLLKGADGKNTPNNS